MQLVIFFLGRTPLTVSILSFDHMQAVGSPLMIQCTGLTTTTGLEENEVMFNWLRNGNDINTNDRVFINRTTFINNTYTSSIQFTYLMVEDEGNYTCIMTIPGNRRSDSVVLSEISSKQIIIE